MARERVIIVGAGVGGLTAAALLASADYDVTVLEAQGTPGGKLRSLPVDGIEVDAGPTVFTMRDVFDGIFEACGARLDDHIVLRPATVLARHAWSDGSRLDLFADSRESENAVGGFAGSDAARGYRAFRAEAKRIHDALDRPFLRASKTDPIRLGWRMGIAALPDYLNLRPYTSLWRALGGYFPDVRLRQLFARYATYCGSDPFRTPATLMLIAHVEASGVWCVERGMHQLAGALATLAGTAGARLRYNAPVAEILARDRHVAGVVLADGERIHADRVIVNADPAALAAGRFGTDAARAVGPVLQRDRSLSAFVWLAKAATSGFAFDHHNVFFSNDYRAEFADIRGGRTPGSPSVYVCRQGSDDRYQIIVNAPANGDTHPYTAEEIDRCQTRMLNTLERCGAILAPKTMSVLTPNDFEALNPSTGGALYGRASHGWAASFRRQGSRTRMPGLYCVGGSTHPGAGVPMAALSGRLAVECLLSDRASTATSRRAVTAGGMSTRSVTTVPTA